MQLAAIDDVLINSPANMTAVSRDLSPAAMATFLRRIASQSARCFAMHMYEDAAWANEAWGAYWADVVRLV